MMPALPAQRQRAILDLVACQDYASITEIRAVTGASVSTVHRDLAQLCESGAVRRIHGGVTRGTGRPDPTLVLRERLGSIPAALDRGDLATVSRLLSQAMLACDQLRRTGLDPTAADPHNA